MNIYMNKMPSASTSSTGSKVGEGKLINDKEYIFHSTGSHLIACFLGAQELRTTRGIVNFINILYKFIKVYCKNFAIERMHLLMRGIHIFVKLCYREIRAMRGLPVIINCQDGLFAYISTITIFTSICFFCSIFFWSAVVGPICGKISAKLSAYDQSVVLH